MKIDTYQKINKNLGITIAVDLKFVWGQRTFYFIAG